MSVQVRHGILDRAEVRRALLHLTHSKEKNPRLKKYGGAVLPQAGPQPPPCLKRNVHLKAVVDGKQ